MVRWWSGTARSLSRFASARRPRAQRRLTLEVLEDRTVLSSAGASTGQILQEYGQIPLSFEVNQGQTAAQVDFLSQGNGYALFLAATEAVLSLQKPAPAAGDGAGAPDSVVLRSIFVGANPQPQVVGLDPLAGTSNYFIGSDPAQWHTNVANYGQVEYRNLYPGVDLVFYGNQRQLEYDYVVAPGTDPGVIKLAIDGAESMTIDGQGNLVLHTSAGDVAEDAPIVYQESSGVRQPVSGQFVLEGDGQIGFALGAYDHSQPLVIDPVLSYSTYLGTGDTEAFGIAVDTAGNAYVTGASGAYVFVTKLNPTGTALVYSTFLGGANVQQGLGIAVDTAGDAYVTGNTYSTDFPTTTGAFQTSLGGQANAFVTKLNPTGTALVYSTYLGGTNIDWGFGIAVDNAGNAYVTGFSEYGDFPTTAGAFQTSYGGGDSNAFVTKLNPTGTALVYSTYLGSSASYDYGRGIAVDAAGNAYVTGYTDSNDFPTTTGAFQTSFGGFIDAFVTKLNPTGTALVYSTYLGGTGDDGGWGIAVDNAGNAYVTGSTESADFPTTTGAYQTTYVFVGDAFVTKLNPTGTALVYSTYLGAGEDAGRGIAVDNAGNAYVTGATGSNDFPTTTGAYQTTYGGGEYDAFVTKLNPTGTALVYSTYLGGMGNDQGNGIAVDNAGNAYATGFTGSADFPTTTGAYQTTFGGVFDAFVTKFAFEVQTTTALTTSVSPSTYGQSVTFTATISDTAGGVPTGSVEFYDGTTDLGPGSILSGSGNSATSTFTTSTLAAGIHSSISAVYSPIGSFVGSSGSLSQTVKPAPLTLTAANESMPYGGTVPALIYTYTGLVNGDTSATFNGALATTATSSSSVGGYPITQGTLAAAGNYTIGTFIPGTLTVTMATNGLIIVLDPSASGALSLSGNASIDVSGVVYVDSSSSSALSAAGNAHVNASAIDVHGGVRKSGNASLSPTPITGAQTLADPLSGLALPSTSGLASCGTENLSGSSSATIQPGIYKKITVSGNAKLTLSTGIYIIEGGGFSVSGNANVSGSGVMIFNAGSKYPSTGGSYGSISLAGHGSYSLSPLSSGTYAGIVIFQPKDNTNALSVSGNASGMTGTIYAPAAQLNETGNGQLNAAIVVDTMAVSGNGVTDGLALGSPEGTVAYSQAQIRSAYGLPNVSPDGTSGTIAIVDAYDNPSSYAALDASDTQFVLTSAGPTLYDQHGRRRRT